MPIPKPNPGEEEKVFIGRCMGHEGMRKEYPDGKQHAAICYSTWRDSKMKKNESHIKENWQKKMFDGEQYLVAPVILLKEGVHNGSDGPLFYSSEELERTAHLWDDSPLTVQHPTKNGTPSSARNPEIYEKQTVGRVWNVEFKEGALRGEAWVSERKMKKHPELTHYIESNKSLDVSTGLFSEDTKSSGKWNEEEYVGIVKNIIPNHLAFLPGGVGACSWDDGCGVRANEEKGWKENEPPSAKHNVEEGGMTMEKKDKETKKEGAPCCPDKVAALIANEATKWAAEDAEFLNGLTENQLSKLEPVIVEKEVIKEVVKEVKANSEGLTMEQYIANAPEEMRDVLMSGLAMHRHKKEEMIRAITANARNKFKAEQLSTMKLHDLESIHSLAITPDYSGRGGDGPKTNSEHVEEPLIAPEMTFEKK